MVKGEIFTAQTTFEIHIKKLKILRIFCELLRLAEKLLHISFGLLKICYVLMAVPNKKLQ